jgi:hypothetical protein
MRTKAEDRLSRFALAAGDGAFVARQGDAGVELSHVLDHLPPALVAVHERLSAHS